MCVPLKHSVTRRLKGTIKRSKVQVHPKVPLKVYRVCVCFVCLWLCCGECSFSILDDIIELKTTVNPVLLLLGFFE